MKKLLLIALLVFGCAGVIETALEEHLDNIVTTHNKDDDLKQAWIGEHKSFYIRNEGIYSRKTKDGSGGRNIILGERLQKNH